MKKTGTPATRTHVVSMAGTTSWFSVTCKAVLSVRRESGQGLSPDAPDCRNASRARHCPAVQDLRRGYVPAYKPPANCADFQQRGRRGRRLWHTRAAWNRTNGSDSMRARGPVRAAAVLLLAFAIVFGAVGCGGGSDRLSKAQYESKLKGIGTDLQTSFNAIQNQGNNLGAIETKVSAAQAKLQSAATEVKGLKPPKDAAVDNAKLGSA